MNLLVVENVSKEGIKGFKLKDISFSQNKLQKIAIAGETGSGKSTLLKIIAGLEQPDSGDVLLENKRVKGPYEKLIPGYPQIAYLSQYFELRHHYTIEEVLSFVNKLSDEDAKAIYKVCRIDHLLQRKTDQLSGGEQQRVALAKLLVTSPQLLLLDEPFSNLDIIHKNILKTVIEEIGEKLNITCIMVSHDPIDTLSWAEEIIVMHKGEIVQKGAPQQIYNRPLNEYVAALFGKYSLLSAKLTRMFCKKDSGHNLNKRLLLRPENVHIARNKEDAEGCVKKINYYGSYYDVEIGVEETIIHCRPHSINFNVGDKVALCFSGEYWCI